MPYNGQQIEARQTEFGWERATPVKISNFSIRRPVFTLVVMIAFIILGAVSVTRIPLQLIPSINPPVGAVVASYQGAGPQEVLQKVTKPLEDQLGTLEGLKNISSTSQEGSSLVILEFTNDTEIDTVQSDIQNAIDQTNLPDEVQNARFLKFDPSQFPIIQLAISHSDQEDNFSDKVGDLERELSQVNGVANVSTQGLKTEEIKVRLDQNKLEEHHLTQAMVVQALQGNDVSLPGATVKSGEKELTTRVLSPLHSLKDIRKVKLTTPTGEELTVGDISKVKTAPENNDMITRNNRKPAVLMNVLQQADANTEQVSENVRERLDELMDDNKYEHIQVANLFDQGDLVDQAITSLKDALILGGLFAMLVLFFFLRNLKTPLIISISIPFSVIVTFVLIYFSGFTLNIMTLGGLALGIGMLVDNSIVVIENVYRHLNKGEAPKAAAAKGTKEVGVAITASTLTTVAVFVPVVFVTGIIGDLFKQFALTIAFSLLASLFVALTVVPMIASRILKTPDEDKEAKRQRSSSMQSLGRAVEWVLHHRISVLLLTLLLFAGGIFGLTRVGAVFLPEQDEGFFTIDVQMENGTTLNKTSEAVKKIEDVLADEDDIKDYFSLIGSSQNLGPQSSGESSQAQIYINMIEPDKRDVTTSDFIENIREDVIDAAPEAEEVTLNRHSSVGTQPNTLTFNVKSDDLKPLKKAVGEISDEIESMSHTVEVADNLTDTVKELQVNIDKEEAHAHGLTPQQIGQIVNEATRGTDALEITNNDGEVRTVHVSYDPDVTDTKKHLKTLLIQTNSGDMIQLSDVADLKTGDSPVTINRDGQARAVQFSVQFSNETTLGEFKSAVQEEIDDLDLDESIDVSYTGDFDLLQDTTKQLAMAFILAVVLVYLVMAAQFESFKYPFVIMLSVPLIFIGVSVALTATLTPISATALIGLIVLAGIVVNNAIVLVDYILQLKARGYPAFDAIVESVKVRTRPILMTAVTTILGLLPVAIGYGQGTEIQQPMGITVVGGMISSTFLTLFVIPVVFSYFDPETRRRNKVYVTPDGIQIPAYLVEERKVIKEGHTPKFLEDQTPFEQDEEDGDSSEQADEGHTDLRDESESRDDKNEQAESDSESRRDPDEVIGMLEELLDMAKRQRNDDADDQHRE